MHIRKHRDGYRVIVQHGGRRLDAITTTRIAAQLKGADLLRQLGGQVDDGSVTVALAIAEWRRAVDPPHSPTYAEDISRVVDDILPLELLETPVGEVNRRMIVQLYRSLTEQGFSGHRVRRVHQVLRSAFQTAIAEEWVTSNPVALVKPPTVAKRDVNPPSPKDVVRLLTATRGTTLGLYLEVSATTGARRGEVVGLQWRDLTEDGTALIIRRSLVWTHDSGLVIRPTKTGDKGHRVVSISAITAKRLTKLHLDQRAKALARGLPEPVWIFSHTAGDTPWLPNYPTNLFVETCQALKIRGVRLHDLRHFVATQLLAAGEPLTTVSHRLGHAKMSTTADTYAHFVQAADRHATATMDAILHG